LVKVCVGVLTIVCWPVVFVIVGFDTILACAWLNVFWPVVVGRAMSRKIGVFAGTAPYDGATTSNSILAGALTVGGTVTGALITGVVMFKTKSSVKHESTDCTHLVVAGHVRTNARPSASQ
jgi:hypothetical protein